MEAENWRLLRRSSPTGRGEVMRKEKWIVYRDRCQSLEKKLSLLESERDRLRKGLEEIAKYPTCGLTAVEDVRNIAFAALESSQPEGKCNCPPNGFCPKCKGKLDKRAAYCASQPEGRDVDGWDKSEINILKGLLAEVPTENVIDRMGLESRLQRLLEKKEVHYRAKRDVTAEELARVLLGLAPGTIETITLSDCE